LNAIKTEQGGVEEDAVVIAIPVCGINIIKALGKLDKGSIVTFTTVEHETYASTEGFGVVDVVVAIEVDDEGCIGQKGRDSQLYVHGTCLLLMITAWTLLAGDVNKHREACINSTEV
jgi:hypothetical protein